jgi:aminoglycoside phosphotransferase (APT) family kinase protein
MTYEAGRTVHLPADEAGFTRDLVEALVHIHEGGPPRSPGHRDQAARLDAQLDEESPRRSGVDVDPELWSHIRRLWPSVERREATLIHDDYHPGNVLWHRGRIAAIVDWTVPGIGQAASDACYLRLDVSLVRGLDAGDAVLAAYEAARGEPVPDRPFWDLLSATRAVGIADAWYGSWVDFGIPGISLPLVEQRLDAFVARALAEI